MQVFHRLGTQLKSTQVEWHPFVRYSNVLSIDIRIRLPWKFFFFMTTCVYFQVKLWVRLATQCKSLCKVSQRLLASPFGLECRVILIHLWFSLRFQQHQSLAQSVKGSRYYQTIPPVQVECPLLDGDPTSIPIIFEDKYSFSEPREPGTYRPFCLEILNPN